VGIKGDTGPQGPQGTCDCSCVPSVQTFITPDISGGIQDVKLVYSIPNQCHFVVYGFDNSNNPQPLYVKAGQSPSYENGIGFISDQPNDDHEINPIHHAQIDLGDFQRARSYKCPDPTLQIGSIQLGEGFQIYGSNTLGPLGTLLYSYTNTVGNTDAHVSQKFIIPSYNSTDLSKIGDIYLYGATPFRYISVTAISGDVTLNLLTLNLCNSCYTFAH
jgi:hypothetical protein